MLHALSESFRQVQPFHPRDRGARHARWTLSPALRERGLPGGVQPGRFAALPAVAAMLELVNVESDALALAGERASAGAVLNARETAR